MANPDSVSIFTQFMADIKAATQAVPGFVPTQVYSGQVEFEPSQESFYQQVAENGFYFVVGMPNGEGSFYDWNGSFEVTGELFYPVPADVPYDWVAPNEMIAAMIGGWAHWTQPSDSQWTGGQNRSPLRFKWDKPEIKHYLKQPSRFLSQWRPSHHKAYIVTTKFTFTMPFIADQVANPFENPSV